MVLARSTLNGLGYNYTIVIDTEYYDPRLTDVQAQRLVNRISGIVKLRALIHGLNGTFALMPCPSK